MDAKGLQRYKRLLLAKRDELTATDEAATPVPPADELAGHPLPKMIHRANGCLRS